MLNSQRIFSHLLQNTCVCMLGVIILSACQKNNADPRLVSVERAYAQQKEAQSRPPSLENKEVDPQSLIITPDYQIPSEWKRQPYENLEQWLIRIHREIDHKTAEVALEQDQLKALLTQKQQLIALIDELRSSNEELERSVTKAVSVDSIHMDELKKSLSIRSQMPFLVHLVRPGDTLYSISQKYYQTSKVQEILSWNQGWIQNEDEIVAGMGLVLFLGDDPTKQGRGVEQHLQDLQVDQE